MFFKRVSNTAAALRGDGGGDIAAGACMRIDSAGRAEAGRTHARFAGGGDTGALAAETAAAAGGDEGALRLRVRGGAAVTLCTGARAGEERVVGGMTYGSERAGITDEV